MNHLSESVSLQPASTLINNSLIAEVSLLKRMPRASHFFDYALSPNHTYGIGDLVKAPFRTKIVAGVIVNIKDDKTQKRELKELPPTWLSGYVPNIQLKLAHKISEHYGISLGSALMLFCQPLPLNKDKETREIIRVNIDPNKRITPSVICCDTDEQHSNIVTSLVGRISSDKQILILFGNKNEAQKMSKKISQAVYYTSDSKMSELRTQRKQINNGTIRIVVGTRSALFLPFKNLGGIIVCQPENENFKQYDQNPRYDGCEVASWLAELSGAKLAFVSIAPPLGAWHASQNGVSTWRRFRSTNALVSIIDLLTDQMSGKGLISSTLKERISNAIKYNSRVLLYLNRRGNATSAHCRDCGFQPTCAICRRQLVLDSKMNRLRCYQCGKSELIPLHCPKCRGLNVIYSGAGLAELESEVTKIWPGLSVARVEGEGTFENIDREIAASNIVLGTKLILGYINSRKFDLIVMVQPDGELSLPEYRGNEEMWATARIFQGSGVKNIIIQTRNAKSHIWQSLVANEPNIFYKKELDFRAELGYPPSANLVRLTAQANYEQVALELAKGTRDVIRKELPKSVYLLGPYPDYYHQVRGRYRFHILLRYPKTGYDPSVLWPLLADDILIDRHPLTVLG